MQCTHGPRSNCCVTNDACDDSDPCTVDVCMLGDCMPTPSPDCVADGGNDAAVEAPDAGWFDADVHGGGCACQIASRPRSPLGGLFAAVVACGMALSRLRRRRRLTR